ncbi:hypothetical protein P152DRAFT_451707 [Eremomyces bilateralis CBS 781.70]|uniref:Aminoglycoside phosphotransferase domain-containing protein n=1 Tax=Eremomyces bilateralis CBS 781.70 TaxID=1392243 RepID=A0A6G1FV30_9PEZI|nr:uncharacterized protein P152DRAFT_451707 [Eremomyces bilateralis CBS 781.70]KAF1809755.1 hypothetical protein P152DRAFT_451707 [Eremomyces bilateralis CBS 781.70]
MFCLMSPPVENSVVQIDQDRWLLGDAMAKAWRTEMQLESDTIQFVNRVSSLPTPKIVYSWIDTYWSRSFLILESVKGKTLAQAWDTLSSDRRTQLASTVARFCKALAAMTSGRLETADGTGIVEPFLIARPPDSEPSWKPQFLGPYSIELLQSYLADPSATKSRAIAPFLFYYVDLGPGNIIVDDDGDLVAILDWESAAFHPMFWLGTKPLLSAGFLLPNGDRKAWAILLTKALELEGFAPDMDRYLTWKRAIGKNLIVSA